MSLGKRAYDMMRGYVNREWDRIQGEDWTKAESELFESLQTPGYPVPPAAVEAPEVTARKVLGVAPDADFAAIRHAFEKLCRRADPANFPGGSEEATHAAEILRRVHWAYGVLTENVDPTSKRFQSLEID
jgi:hypothetical protein